MLGDNPAGRGSALPKVIPERIREAREARGLTAEGFGELLGVSRAAVALYETGQVGPSPDVFTRILAVTEQPVGFFFNQRRRKAESAQQPFWRSLKRMEQAARARITRRLEWACDIVDYIEAFIELPKANFPPVEWDHEQGKDDEIEVIALKLRDLWGLGRGPIADLVSVLEYNGVVLVRETVACDDMDAVSRWQMGRPFILYSAEVESGPRVNFNLAHELAHIVLHGGVEVTSDNLPRLERQANRFAGAFLLPRDTFPLEVVSTSLTYFKTLKERWRVAIAAMIYRCKDLAILNESQVKYLWRQMNAQGIRQREPLDDAFGHVAPTMLRTSLEMLVSHGVQSKEDVERAIHLNPADIESLGGIDPGWLTAGKVIAFKPKPRLRISDSA